MHASPELRRAGASFLIAVPLIGDVALVVRVRPTDSSPWCPDSSPIKGAKVPVVVDSKTRLSKFGYKGPSEKGHDLVLFPVRPSFLSGTSRVYRTLYHFSTHIKSPHDSCYATREPRTL